MAPTILQYFRSFYYPATHLNPIDLDKNLKRHRCQSADIAQLAEKVISLPQVQDVLSEPLSYDYEPAKRKNEIMENLGFRILAKKQLFGHGSIPYYSVSEHPDLQGWIIKAGGYRIPSDMLMQGMMSDRNEMTLFTAFESFLRLEMNERIRKKAKSLGIDLAVPKEYAIPYPHPKPGDVSRRYFIISEKLNILSVEDTVRKIVNMAPQEQIDLAKKISHLIKKVGFADSTFDNIRFTTDGKLAIVDTEPAGLFIAKNDRIHPKSHSVEKCARIGLWILKTITNNEKLAPFSKEVDNHYQKSLKELSITKITISVLCPLIPLVFLVMAAVNHFRIQQMGEQIIKLNKKFHQEHVVKDADFEPARHQFLSSTKWLRDHYFLAIEGVPF